MSRKPLLGPWQEAEAGRSKRAVAFDDVVRIPALDVCEWNTRLEGLCIAFSRSNDLALILWDSDVQGDLDMHRGGLAKCGLFPTCQPLLVAARSLR
jgi:hypothetical protein